MSRIIATIQGVDIQLSELNEIVYFRADADIDCDGSGGNPDHDPWYQDDTTLHAPDGGALNAYKVPFVVVPPVICQKTVGRVLGAECLLTHTLNGRRCLCVVGDIGPRKKIGEISPAAALAIGVNPNARTGGEERHVIDYEIRVGKPALIDGVLYDLKSFGGG